MDDLERVYSQPSRFLTFATELAKFAGLSGADRKDNFSLLLRRDVENLIGASYQVEFSSLGYRQPRVSSVRSIHSRSRIFALDRRQTRLLFLFPFFSPIYHRPISPYHSIFTFTSRDVYRNLLGTSRFFSPREIFALIPGEVTKISAKFSLTRFNTRNIDR